MTSDPREEPSARSGTGRSGRRPGIFHSFSERRDRAWDRVKELEQSEEKRIRADAHAHLERLDELLEGHDPEGPSRPVDQSIAEHEAAMIDARKARRRAMLLFELPVALTGWTILAAVAAVNSLWLGAVGVDYLGWYLQSGFLTALAFGVVAVAINLDSLPGLISAHPFGYLAEISLLFSQLSAALTNVFGRPRSDRALADVGLVALTYRYRLRALDLALTLLFALLFGVAMLAWVLLIAPLQYWVNLVCGAPAREALASSRTLWVVTSAHQTVLLFASKDPGEFEERELGETPERGERTEVGFAAKPVSFTAAIAAGVLFGISQLV